MAELPTPVDSGAGAVDWVAHHLRGLFDGPPRASEVFVGTQYQADAALTGFDVSGYAAGRNAVLPGSGRSASMLSPYIRHGLLPLPEVWRAVSGGPTRDVTKFHDELLWQEYARHLYARLGSRARHALRFTVAGSHSSSIPPAVEENMACWGWLTERLHAELPVVFNFDEPLLRRLRLTAPRLVFLVQRLAELAQSRQLHVFRGRPAEVLRDITAAATYTPVPGWRRISSEVALAQVHPWPWLLRPTSGAISSFSAWNRSLVRPPRR
jgi:hypothetical protein